MFVIAVSFFLVLSNLFPFSAQTTSTSQVETVYHQEADKTTVSLAPVKISGPNDKYQSLHLAPSFSYAGKHPQRPELIDIELRSVVKGRLNTDLYVLFVFDGEKIFLSSNRWAIKRPVAGRVWVGERLVFRMPYETFLRLVSAKSVEIRFDAVRFPVTEASQQSLRDLLKYMDSATTPH